MGNITAWLLLGLIVSAIAMFLAPQARVGRIISTIALGIIGAFVGGTLWVFFTNGQFIIASAAFNPASLVFSVVGATIAIFVWHLFTRQAV